MNIFSTTKNIIIDILFPNFCVNCEREGELLCQDCLYLIDILEYIYCPYCGKRIVGEIKICEKCQRKNKNLSGIFCAASYDNFIIKKIIRKFKYEPFIKELSKTLSFLIIIHLLKSDNLKQFKNFVIIPVPLHKSKMKEKGFNHSEEIGKELAKELKIPIYGNILVKIKKTLSQTELKKKERLENVKNSFSCQNPQLIKDKNILLVDDIFTTGSTMEECAKVLKESGAKKILGMVAARG